MPTMTDQGKKERGVVRMEMVEGVVYQCESGDGEIRVGGVAQ